MKPEHSAKRKMLEALKKDMSKEDSMGLPEALGSKMHKVTVAADSKEGLAKGLDKAKEIMQKRSEMLGLGDEKEEGSTEEEASETPEEESTETEELSSPEEDSEDPAILKKRIAELKAKLKE
jgi:hypothetical protein